jgi:hypothetical protein
LYKTYICLSNYAENVVALNVVKGLLVYCSVA